MLFKTWSDMEVNKTGVVDVLPRSIQFDRLTGEVKDANVIEKAVILALQAGSKVTRPFGHRGYPLPPVSPKEFRSSLGTDHRAVIRRPDTQSRSFEG